MIERMELPIIDKNQPIAIDLETCDPELKTLAPGYVSQVGFVAGIAIAVKEGAWYIPVGHTEGENYKLADVVKWLNDTLSADTDKIFHNAQYDLGWLKYIGVQVHGQIFDTMLAAALLDETRRQYSLDSIGMDYLGEGKNEVALEAAVKAKFGEARTHKTYIQLKENIDIDYKPFIDAKTRVSPFYELWPECVRERYTTHGYVVNSRGQELYKVPTKTAADIKGLLWAIDPEVMGSYPIQDVDLTYRLYKEFLPILKEENLMTVMNLENEVLPCLLEMREQGVKVDMKQAIKLDKKFTKELDAMQKELNVLAGKEIDVNVDSDLIYLCEKFNLEYARTPRVTLALVPRKYLNMSALVRY